MQSKGIIRLVAIVIGVACIYQLAFTWVTRNQESKAKDYAEATVAAAAHAAGYHLGQHHRLHARTG